MSDNTFSRVKKNQMKYIEKTDEVVKPLNNIDDVLKTKEEVPEKSISDVVKKETVYDETLNELINIRDLIEDAKSKQLDNIKKLNTKYDILTKMELEEKLSDQEEKKVVENEKPKDLKSILERYGIRQSQLYKDDKIEENSANSFVVQESLVVDEANASDFIEKKEAQFDDGDTIEIPVLKEELKPEIEMTFETMYRKFLDDKGNVKSEFADTFTKDDEELQKKEDERILLEQQRLDALRLEEEQKEELRLANEQKEAKRLEEEKKYEFIKVEEEQIIAEQKLREQRLEDQRIENERIALEEETARIAKEQLEKARQEVEEAQPKNIFEKKEEVEKLYETSVMKTEDLKNEKNPIIIENPQDNSLFQKMDETVEMKFMEEIAKKEIVEGALAAPVEEEEKVSIFWMVLLLVFIAVLFIIILQYRGVIWDAISKLIN